MNTKPAVILNIQRQPGTNIIGVADRVKDLLPRLQASLPSSMQRDHAHRPHHHHSRLREGRAIRVDAYGRAGRDGHVPVSAQSLPQRSSQASPCRSRLWERSA